MYKRLTTVAGKTVLVRYTDCSRIKTEKRVKHSRKAPTPEEIQKVNRINQRRNLTAILNHNFEAGDKWMRLSYPKKISINEAMKIMQKFKRKLRAYCKKNGIELKIIESTGIGQRSGKPHHHIVINRDAVEAAEKLWDEHDRHAESLWSDGNYEKIAEYMLQNAYESQTERGKHSKAWRASRSVKKPETKVEEMKRPPVRDVEDIKPRKGYYIDPDSIRKYEHKITGALCIEYIEISLEEHPRLRRYNKGRKAQLERIYKIDWDEQLTFGLENEHDQHD